MSRGLKVVHVYACRPVLTAFACNLLRDGRNTVLKFMTLFVSYIRFKMKIPSSLLLAFLCCTVLPETDCQSFVGDPCQQTDGSSGICQLLKGCQSAQEGIRQGKRPKICGFSNFEPIVCCPASVSQQIGRSQQMCKKYAEAVFVIEEAPVFIPDAVTQNKSTCAIVGTTFITGGEKAEPREFPHMAVVGFGDEPNILWGCGGSLISDRFVLTAAHCMSSSLRGEAKWVRLGDLVLQDDRDDAEPQQIRIAERIRHPDFKPPAKYNDIALFKLDRDVKFTPYVRPACLHAANSIPADNATATGWGRTGFASDSSDHLLKVSLKLAGNDVCNQTYKSEQKTSRLRQGIVESMLCAGEFNTGMDTCQGDSGGPLQYVLKDPFCMYSIIGVTSFGKLCGFQPAVYTRVSNFVPWIEKIVWG